MPVLTKADLDCIEIFVIAHLAGYEMVDAPSKAPENFRELVYDMVRQIPVSRVASYGQIAELLGYPKHSRLVGSCLKVWSPHDARVTEQ